MAVFYNNLATRNNSKLHIMGLLSDGGIHSHINHHLKEWSSLKYTKFLRQIAADDCRR